MENYVYCVLKNRIVWDTVIDSPKSISTKLMNVFETFEDANYYGRDIIDQEEKRLRRIKDTSKVERQTDHHVICGFGYEDVEYNVEIQQRKLN